MRGCERQLVHARARLEPYLPSAWNLDLVELLRVVTR